MAAVNESPLWALIRAEMKRHDYSYRQIEERSNGEISKGDLGFWKNDTKKLISPSKLVSLAKVLDVSLVRVVDAALATTGLDVGRSLSVEDAIRQDDTLPELGKRQLLRMVQEYREQVEDDELPEGLAARRRGKPAADESDRVSE